MLSVWPDALWRLYPLAGRSWDWGTNARPGTYASCNGGVSAGSTACKRNKVQYFSSCSRIDNLEEGNPTSWSWNLWSVEIDNVLKPKTSFALRALKNNRPDYNIQNNFFQHLHTSPNRHAFGMWTYRGARVATLPQPDINLITIWQHVLKDSFPRGWFEGVPWWRWVVDSGYCWFNVNCRKKFYNLIPFRKTFWVVDAMRHVLKKKN